MVRITGEKDSDLDTTDEEEILEDIFLTTKENNNTTTLSEPYPPPNEKGEKGNAALSSSTGVTNDAPNANEEKDRTLKKTESTQSISTQLVAKGSESNQFNILPDEILIKIYELCDIPALGRIAQVCKRFHRLSGDLPMWKQMIQQKAFLESNNDSGATRSYYIKRFKQFKERQRKIEEDERRKRKQTKMREREERCVNLLLALVFNRVYEWFLLLSVLWVTITTVLKLQGAIDWNWALIFIPLYFYLFQFLYGPVVYDVSSACFHRDFEDDLTDDHRYLGSIFYLFLFIMNLGYYSDLRKRSIVYINTICSVVFVILFLVKIAADSFAWWGVFIPLYIQALYIIVLIVAGDYERLWEDDQWIDRVLVIGLILNFVLSIIFISLKLDDSVDWSWYVTLIPLWVLKGLLIVIPIILTMVNAFASYSIRSKTRWTDDAGAYFAIAAGVAVLLLGPLLVFEVLLAQHAEGDIDTPFKLVFVPIFILEGCACLGCISMDWID